MTGLRLAATGRTPGRLFRKRPLYLVGDRARRASCSDVVWLGEETLATCNLNGSIDVYQLEHGSQLLKHRQRVRSKFALAGIALSPDAASLAVTHSDGGRVAVHAVRGAARVARRGDRKSPILSEHYVHGARFSPDGRYVLATQFVPDCTIVVLDAQTLRVVGALATPFTTPDTLLAKSLAFSRDGRFVIVSYATTVSASERATHSTVAVHGYAADSGELSAPLSSIKVENSAIESVDVLDDRTLLAVDQYSSCVLTASFDPDGTGLTTAVVDMDSTDGFDFPHGIAVGPTGLVALTDHAQDAVRVFTTYD